jgi:hypothetical protein
MFRRTKGQTDDGLHPWKITTNLGVKFRPKGEVKNWLASGEII